MLVIKDYNRLLILITNIVIKVMDKILFTYIHLFCDQNNRPANR